MKAEVKDLLAEVSAWVVHFEKTLSPTYAHMLAAKVPELCNIIEEYEIAMRKLDMQRRVKPDRVAIDLIADTIKGVMF